MTLLETFRGMMTPTATVEIDGNSPREVPVPRAVEEFAEKVKILTREAVCENAFRGEDWTLNVVDIIKTPSFSLRARDVRVTVIVEHGMRTKTGKFFVC